MKNTSDQRANPGRVAALDKRHPWLRVPDMIAIGVIAVIAVGAAVVAMMESYTNLLDFAKNHELHGWRAGAAPGAVDSFIVLGELLLFVVIYRGWNKARTYRGHSVPAVIVMWGWGLALFGFTLSVLGNLDSRISADVVTRLMSAVFPVSATVALAAGLMILKRVAQDYRKRAEAQADIRPHGELLYMLGGFPAPIAQPVPVPAVTAPKRRKAVAPPEPKITLPALTPAPAPVQAELPPARPRAVPDPDPQPGQVSRPIQMTDEIWRDLESGMPAKDLADRYPSLGSRFRVKQIVDAHLEGRLVPGTRENVDGAPVIWAGGPDAEVASDGR
jgi:hypothetical protein